MSKTCLVSMPFGGVANYLSVGQIYLLDNNSTHIHGTHVPVEEPSNQ